MFYGQIHKYTVYPKSNKGNKKQNKTNPTPNVEIIFI